jgi:hypothetical protein
MDPWEARAAHTFEGLLTSHISPALRLAKLFSSATHTQMPPLPRIKPQGKISKVKKNKGKKPNREG